jgi:Mrp family chromosome partitioning ATPase
MLDALKRAGQAREDADLRPSAPPPAAPAEETEATAAGAEEEIPFIEVGPHKSLEASPSVLACSPRAEPGPVRPDPPFAALPPPHGVQFRALSGREGPRGQFAPELVAYHAPGQPAARQYGEVLAAVLNASSAEEGGAALLFTPALPQGGNTTTVLNLAVTAARRDRRVVVVEANLSRPAVAERLGLPAGPGLREALAGSASLDEVVRETEQANLFALTAGAHDAAGVRFLAGTVRSLLRQLRRRFPLVFVDGPRWDGRADVTALGAACDAVFLVVSEVEAQTPQTDALLQHIPAQGARLAGCVLVAGSHCETGGRDLA